MSDTKLISLRVPLELLAEIDLIAEEEKRSRAQVIVLALSGDEKLSSKVATGKSVGKDKESTGKKKFSDVARRGTQAQSIVDKELLDAEFDPPIGSVVARGQKSSVVASEGAELNTGDALAGFGISAPVSPIYGGIERVAHDTKTCRIYKCGMCAVIKAEGK